jgi:hypothetical protein
MTSYLATPTLSGAANTQKAVIETARLHDTGTELEFEVWFGVT